MSFSQQAAITFLSMPL
uniref:Uncharacterized protein n=1 Tax=Anguilla anguilla TaxID=7936 RepID=A0A0E9UY76_ANGAN